MTLYFNNFETAILFTTVLVVNVPSQILTPFHSLYFPALMFLALVLCCANFEYRLGLCD